MVSDFLQTRHIGDEHIKPISEMRGFNINTDDPTYGHCCHQGATIPVDALGRQLV